MILKPSRRKGLCLEASGTAGICYLDVEYSDDHRKRKEIFRAQ